MSIPFKELGGSPQEQYNSEGFRAKRTFLIAWEDRDAFAVEVLGLVGDEGAKGAVYYPGKPSAAAIKVRYEPFDPDNPDAKEIPDLTSGLNSYSNSFAKATVEYQTVTARDRLDGPLNEEGTHLTYRMLFEAELEPIIARSWHWADIPSIGLPEDQALVKRIPVTVHHLTWYQVIKPPWDVIHDCQGTVNSTEFLGCPPGTLLFEGAEANKLFRAGLDEGPAAFCWQIHYVFREKSIKHDGQVYGWNHAYRENPPGWAEPTHGADRLYDAGDFAPLFQSAKQ
jgi:hypothetical protein